MKGTVVILANGQFPRKGSVAYRTLAAADKVVCCDGAADVYRRRMHREPEAVVGDCDSVKGRFARMVRVTEQDTNDLEKAVAYCRSCGWKKPLVVGAGGKRDDHALGNVFRALALDLELLTDYGRFVPVRGRLSLKLEKGTAVSIFATDRETRMTSRGLAWPLQDVRFDNLYCATLNRADAPRVTVTATHPVYVYVAFGSGKGR